MLVSVLGAVGTLLVVATGIPQLLSAARARSLVGLSFWTFGLYTISGIVWVAYGVVRSDVAIYLTNIFVTINGLTISCMILVRRSKAGEG